MAHTPRTWAELAWMIIGFYWIGLTILVVPVRLNGTRLLDSALLGLFPMLAAIVLWNAAPRRAQPSPGKTFWTSTRPASPLPSITRTAGLDGLDPARKDLFLGRILAIQLRLEPVPLT